MAPYEYVISGLSIIIKELIKGVCKLFGFIWFVNSEQKKGKKNV